MSGGGYLVLSRADYADGRQRSRLVKVSSEGTAVLDRELAMPSGNVSLLRGVRSAADAIYVTGYHKEPGLASTVRAILIRLGPDGGITWVRSPSIAEDAKGEAVAVGRDGTIVIAGTSLGRPGRGEEPASFVAGFGPGGEAIWQVRLGQGSDSVAAVKALRNGGYLVSRSSGIVRLGGKGEVIWSTPVVHPLASMEMADGSIVVAALGESEGPSGAVLIAKLSGDGEVVWSKRANEGGLCFVIGLWATDQSRIVAVGSPCTDDSIVRVAQFSEDGGFKGVDALQVRDNATAVEAQPTIDGGIIVGGMFAADGPEAGRAWLYRYSNLRGGTRR
jgi:hypothetical protein